MRCTLCFSCLVLPAALCSPPAVDDVVKQSWQAEGLLDEARYEAAIQAYATSIPALTATFGESAKASVRRDTGAGLRADYVVKTEGFASFSSDVSLRMLLSRFRPANSTTRSS